MTEHLTVVRSPDGREAATRSSPSALPLVSFNSFLPISIRSAIRLP